jgi:hypothetical protein
LTQALCWAHARRKFFVLADIAANGKRGKDAAPLSPGLAILKHTFNLSDEVLCERWGGKPLLPVSVRRGVLPPRTALRSLAHTSHSQIDFPCAVSSTGGLACGLPKLINRGMA